MAKPVQLFIAGHDSRADPAFFGIGAWGSTRFDHLMKRGVTGDAKTLFLQRFAQGLGKMEAIQRENCPHSRLYPKDVGVIPTIRHREDARPVGLEQKLWRNDG